MGAGTRQPTARREAVRHLESALATDDAEQKDFHIKQALQLLRVANY